MFLMQLSHAFIGFVEILGQSVVYMRDRAYNHYIHRMLWGMEHKSATEE